MNIDFETFKNEISWFFDQSDEVEFLDSVKEIHLSDNFENTFPVLTALLKQARVLNLKINNQLFKLFSWTNKDGSSCGWLNKIEKEDISELQLIEEHKLLLKEIGGIQESYHQPEESLCNNQNFMFIESECSLGIGGFEEYYEEMCNEEGKEPIDFKHFICFVEEANGNATVYNPKSKDVFLFAQDHCFENVESVENQPEYTFYKINDVNNFVDYVETLASEWRNEIR
ncbi:hypothetical protein LPB86_16980 [Pedobacter sp. MC2016-14]|uniref:hypothetical protein n=1 Tax=Pedobacter sp. MC2016-14 TaxID=2897327 RepID=UPI001E5164E2|nr:hypothetical protein [Pedobacter sp. MC2016-14]MCD0489939.1 hypothetical protein [Pedobacter sp. MC2016-14]